MQRLSKIFILSLIIFFSFRSLDVEAKKSLSDAPSNLQSVTAPTGITETEVTNVVGSVITFGLQLVGFILTVYAGIRWMLSRGEEDKITKARDTMVGAVIGLVITVSAYAITSFVSTRIITGAGDGSSLSPDTLGSGDSAEPLGCCISWTKADILSVSKSTWKIMTESTCKMMNEDLQFDPKNQNKFSIGSCPGPKNGCWLFYSGQDANQCEATWDAL